MTDTNEVLTLLVWVAVAAFGAVGRVRLRSLPEWRLFLASFSLLTAAALFTVLEGLAFGVLLNWAEHICYTASAITLLVWALRICPSAGEESA